MVNDYFVCVSHSQTRLVSLPGSADVSNIEMFPIANLDCAGDHDTLSSANFCALITMDCKYARGIKSATICSRDNCPQNHGETLLTFEIHHGKVTPTLVGFSSVKNYCNLEKPLIFTRISVFRDWIEQVLHFSDEFLVFND
jgi:hypothetical protein